MFAQIFTPINVVLIFVAILATYHGTRSIVKIGPWVIVAIAIFLGLFSEEENKLFAAIFHNGREHADNGLDALKESSETTDTVQYRVTQATAAFVVHKQDFDDEGRLTVTPAATKDVAAGTMAVTAFALHERAGHHDTEIGRELFIPVQFKSGSPTGTYASGEHDPVYLIQKRLLGDPQQQAPKSAATAADDHAPAPRSAAPQPAASAQPNLARTDLQWTGQHILYDDRVWALGYTSTQQVMPPTTADPQQRPVFWLLYLSSQDSNPVTVPVAPGQTFKLCQPRSFATTKPAVLTEFNGHPANSWAGNYTPEIDAQCSWATNFENDQNNVVTLKVDHTAGVGNEFLVLSDETRRQALGWN